MTTRKMTQRQYAAYRKVSKQAVHQAIRSGRIVLDADGRIDVARADAQWLARTDAKQAARALQQQRINGSDLNDAAMGALRLRGLTAETQIAEAKAKALSAGFLDKEEVVLALAALCGMVRDQLLNLSDRLGGLVSPEIKAMIRAEVLSTLRTLETAEVRGVRERLADEQDHGGA